MLSLACASGELTQVGGDQSSFETSLLRRSAAVDFACYCFPKAVVLLPDTSTGVWAEATRSPTPVGVSGSVNVLGRRFEVVLDWFSPRLMKSNTRELGPKLQLGTTRLRSSSFA